MAEKKKNDWKAVVRELAPKLGAALGGPLAGTAVKVVSRWILGREDGSVDEIEAVLAEANPETLLQLRHAEYEFKIRVGEQVLEEERVHQTDRASARVREQETRDWFPKALGGMITGGFFALLGGLLFVAPPPETESVLNVMLGSLGTAFIAVVTYYYGSSAGSKEKTGILAHRSAAQVEVTESDVSVDARGAAGRGGERGVSEGP